MATGDDTASDPFPRPSQTRREGIPHVPGTPKSSPCRDRKRTHHRQRTRPDTHRPCSGNQAVNSAYQVTADGLTIALFLTRLTQRLLIPGLAQLTSPGPPGRSRLRQADRAYREALTDLARQASLAALPHLQVSPAVITSKPAPVISRHTRRNLTRNSKSLRGKITYRSRARFRIHR